jgi:hypothetical protein
MGDLSVSEKEKPEKKVRVAMTPRRRAKVAARQAGWIARAQRLIPKIMARIRASR